MCFIAEPGISCFHKSMLWDGLQVTLQVCLCSNVWFIQLGKAFCLRIIEIFLLFIFFMYSTYQKMLPAWCSSWIQGPSFTLFSWKWTFQYVKIFVSWPVLFRCQITTASITCSMSFFETPKISSYLCHNTSLHPHVRPLSHSCKKEDSDWTFLGICSFPMTPTWF